jgi:hypothetical protein
MYITVAFLQFNACFVIAASHRRSDFEQDMNNGPLAVFAVLRALKFLVVGPLVVLLCLVINLMTSPGDWWVQWVAFGIGIAWVICLLRVLKAALIVGGIAALVKHFRR